MISGRVACAWLEVEFVVAMCIFAVWVWVSGRFWRGSQFFLLVFLREYSISLYGSSLALSDRMDKVGIINQAREGCFNATAVIMISTLFLVCTDFAIVDFLGQNS